jgi:hypothetical protein
MESGRGDSPDERARLDRLLAWRRVGKKGPETHARRWPSYVGSVAWLGFGVLTVALVAQRSGRGPVVATLRPAAAEIIRPLARVEPAALTAERAAKAGPARVRVSEAAYARPDRPAGTVSIGRKALSASVSVRGPGVRPPGTTAPPVAASRLTIAVTTARRWSGYVPEAKEAIVRWVKSQPLSAGRRLEEPDGPQTL